MQTRRKLYEAEPENPTRRRRRPEETSGAEAPWGGFFDGLPEDILFLVLLCLSRSADRPSDLISASLTCRKWKALVLNAAVLSVASPGALAVKASSWSPSADGFLKLCVDAGNPHACYLLGMIKFYCLGDRRGGALHLVRAAREGNPAALYSIAVIKSNGSTGSKSDRDALASVSLCFHAASLGYVAALRELGYCFHDGNGVRRNPAAARDCLIRAAALELSSSSAERGRWNAAAEVASEFLEGWRHEKGEGLVRCFGGCGRVETRRREFRRCSVCGKVKYCSRACQAVDWRRRHNLDCRMGEG